MKTIKNIFTFLWGNKLTSLEVGVSVFAGYCAYILTLFPYIWANITFGIVVGFVGSLIAVRLGFETFSQIVKRLAEQKLTKEQIAKAKEVELKAKEISRQVEDKYKELVISRIREQDAELKAKAESIVLTENQNLENKGEEQ